YKGFGYFNLNHQITNPEILKTLINPMQNNRDVQHIIQNYLRKNKNVKTVDLD
ncbi:MAG: exonuclease, partial [Flavobacteriaceae bacterium]|nr:exonuclease [Flavobacteriaceae bacterium]